MAKSHSMPSTVDDRLEDIDLVVKEVQRLRQDGDWRKSLEVLQSDALPVLNDTLELLDQSTSISTNITRELRSRVARKLADCYGTAGGLHRRLGDQAAAFAHYKKGCEIEQDPQYDIVDSYNLVNYLVLSVLLEPERLSERQQELVKAADRVRQQVEGQRRDSYWALADLGLVSLLGGHADDAKTAYERIVAIPNIPADHLKSITDVLVSCSQSLKEIDPEVTREIDNAVDTLKTYRSK